MKKKLISLILTLIQLSVDFCIVVTSVALVLGIILVACTPFTGFAHELFDYHSWWNLVLQAVAAAMMVFLAIIMFVGVHSLLRNINSGLYFVNQNLVAVRQILWPSLVVFVLHSLASICFRLWNIQDLMGLMTFREGDFSNDLFSLVIFFLIYLIFKRGITLQKDADEII
ncbi:hypothetical protein [Limosilactobacillus oris]|uniref:hypothetical protein n=1 Tax=Limosilactobacillus oris TaxID=1632 RepID=UPI002432704E|nr:hypothetical protein [Limosilactobacillus oris]